MPVTVEINNACPDGRICVDFPYSSTLVQRVKSVSGASFVKTPRRHWHVPKSMISCRALRNAFGDELVIGPSLRSWATEAARQETTLNRLALADTAELVRLPHVLPTLYRAMHVGPIGLTFTTEEQWTEALAAPGSYQTADIKFLADSPAPLNANQQGLGKTPEWIASVWEAGLEAGDHLVVCNSAAVDGTWEPELEQWTSDCADEVGIYACTGTRAQREVAIGAWRTSTAKSRWLIVNTQMIQWRKDPDGTRIVKLKGKKAEGSCTCSASKDPHAHYSDPYPTIAAHTFRTICVDECQKASIRNDKSITHMSIDAIKHSDKRCAMSGTPAKKKGADVWGVLHWLNPKAFPSKFRFAMDFFEASNNGFGWKFGKLREELAGQFADTLKPYALRRTKDECLPWLPPKLHVYVPCTMGSKQAAQYQAMEDDGFVNISGEEVTTTSVLAEFTRLTQFANAYCEVRGGVVAPTALSCKLDAMLEKMDEADVFEDTEQKQLVFSSSRLMVELAAEVLSTKGIKVQIISGGQSRKGQRRAIKEAFQSGGTQVLCIVTTAGGVSLTLDRADTVHFLDESWAPDDTEQAEDRAHRATSGTKQVTIYHYYTRHTLDEYRMEVADDKRTAHDLIWDVRRKLLKEKAV